MTFYTRKIIFGLTLSLAGILLTVAWYKFDLSRSKLADSQSSKIVAHVASIINEVQKKPAQRVIWQNLEDSDELRVGEAVRTSEDSEAKIAFDSGALIEMDPESVITIEEAGDKINLNFVKGNLLVKNSGGGRGGSTDLELKSGNTNIALNNADIALNKSKNGQGMDVQVLQGTAEMQQGANKVTLDRDKSGTVDEKGLNVTEQFIKVKAPQAFAKLFVNVSQKEPVIFEWEPVQEEYEVYLEYGPDRDHLQRMYPSVSGKDGALATPIKKGTYFWRLAAVSKSDANKKYFSLINKLVVLAEVPPQLIEPKKDSIAVLNPANNQLFLRWTNPSHLEKLQVEISADSQFSKNAYSEVLDDSGQHFATLSQDGTYFWRITGFRPGTSKEVVSETHKFDLKTKTDVAPPQIKEGGENQKVSLDAIQKGNVYLAWKPQLGISQYHVRVFRYDGKSLLPLYDNSVNEVTQIKFMGTKPGLYKWDVASVGADGKLSSASKPNTITVDELPNIGWENETTQEEYTYTTERPQLRVKFKPYMNAAYYQLTYTDSSGIQKIEKFTSRASEKTVPVDSDGPYQVFVEAMNAKGETVAHTSVKEYVVKQIPFLPPPEFAAQVPSIIVARKNGQAAFALKPVAGAQSYLVNVKSPNGKIEKTEKVKSSMVTLSDLMPGEYNLSVSSVDARGRSGPESSERKLSVPNVSDTKAPAFKKVRIQ